MTEIHPAFFQLLSVGPLWIGVHCAGMCGPIVGGLTAVDEPRNSISALQRVLRIQGGRALVVSLLGATAGLLGAVVEKMVADVGPWISIGAGVGIAGAAAVALRASATDLVQIGRRTAPAANTFVAAAAGWARRFVDRPAAIGMMIGLLPCMISLWALSLAASTGSPIQGALVMLGLVALTTPVLLIAGVLPRWLVGQSKVARVLQFISGTWLMCVGLAGAGVIKHIHIPFHVGPSGFTVMVW